MQAGKQNEASAADGASRENDIPLISMVTRLTKQKGLDLVRRIMHELLEEQDIQLVVLGTGEREFEDYFRYAEFAFHEKCRAYIGFDEPLAHQIYAGSDMFLMPSKFEPCGLGSSLLFNMAPFRLSGKRAVFTTLSVPIRRKRERAMALRFPPLMRMI
ncbi:glycogen synthase [Bacillus subtilis]|nr:glycogen synthase [Bacillus subtilis]